VPRFPGYYPGAVLTWPCPFETGPQARVKKMLVLQPFPYLSKRVEENGVTRRSFQFDHEELLSSLLLTRNRHARFDWDTEQLVAICSKLKGWWDDEGRTLVAECDAKQKDDFVRSRVISRLRLIAHVAQRIVGPNISRHTAAEHRIADWFADMWSASCELDHPLCPFLFAALHWWPQRADDVLRICSPFSPLSARRSTDCPGSYPSRPP